MISPAVLREWCVDLRDLSALWGDEEGESPPRSAVNRNLLMRRMEGVARFLGWSQTATLLVWLEHEWWVVANRPQVVHKTAGCIRTLLRNLTVQFQALENSSAILTETDPAAEIYQQLIDQWTNSPELLSSPPTVFEIPVKREVFDPVLMDLFLDEATRLIREAMASFAVYLRNPSLDDFLPKLRRQFHTIKGSGRLAGAMRLGEYAWQIEQLLIKWLADSPPSPEVVQQTLALALPGIDRLISELTPSVARTNASVDNLVDIPVDIPVDQMDDPIRTIFLQEGRSCLKALQASLRDGASPAGGGQIRLELVRALHTLAGSAKIAGYPAVGRLAKQLEELADLRLRNHEQATAVEWQLLVRGADQLHWALNSGAAVTSSLDWIELEELVSASGTDAPPEQVDLSRIFADEAMDVVDALELCWEEEITPLAETGRLARTHALATQLQLGARRVEWLGLADLCRILADICALESSTLSGMAIATQLRDVLPECLEWMVDMINQERTGHPLSAPQELLNRLAEIHTLPQESTAHANFLAMIDEEPATRIEIPVEPENDIELRDVFIEEANDLLAETESIIQQWIKAPLNSELPIELKRRLHTLKGSARMVNCGPMGNLAHRFESLLAAVPDVATPAAPSYFELIEDIQMRLESMLSHLQQDKISAEAADLMERIDAHRSLSATDDNEVTEEIGTDFIPESTSPQMSDLVLAEMSRGSDMEPKQVLLDENVRVRAERLDHLVNQAGEIGLYQIRTQQQINGWITHLHEMDETIVRLRDQQRKLEAEAQTQILNRFDQINQRDQDANEEFDPLELERFSTLEQYLKALAESITDLTNINLALHQQSRETSALMTHQSRINTALQEGLMNARLVPFASVIPRMRRIIRQSAQELGKKAQLVVLGGEGELDRAVIEKIMPPLEHMLRNSMVHGIESPEKRQLASKSETGTVTVELMREGAEMLIRLADDGAGIDQGAVRRKAEQRGWLKPETEISSQELTRFIFAPGFSTTESVTRMAGRGVGMDVVHKAVGDLGGNLSLSSNSGQGTEFTIRLPFTLAIHQVLMIAVDNEVYGLPLSSIERVVRLPAEAWCINKKSPTGIGVKWGQTIYNGIELRQLIDSTKEPNTPKGGPLFLVLLQSDEPYVLRVDALIGKREIMVKTLGSQVSSVPGVLGGTLLDTGRVALILDIPALIRYQASLPAEPRTKKRADRLPAPIRQYEVMIVDDSITVRQVTERLFQRQGFLTHVAKDGVDAVALLQDISPDLVILDVEMPRLDGFELAGYIRNTTEFKNIPIIMITSRVGIKHQERARKIGVNAYMGKPYHESALLEKARRLLGIEGG